MPFVKNISMLFASMLIFGCQTTDIPNVKFYAEIPFQDCPEGVYVESLTKKSGIISCEDWKKKRPYMVMIDPKGKEEIFNQWKRACRYADPGKCNVQLDSVKKTIEIIDSIASKVIKKP